MWLRARCGLWMLLCLLCGVQVEQAVAQPGTEPSQGRLVLSERVASTYDLRSHLRFLAAPAHTPIAELAKPETAQRFVLAHRFGRPRDVTEVWVRLRLNIAQDSRDPWLLSVSSMIVLGYAVTAYWQENQTWRKRRLSRITPLAERSVPDAAATFALSEMLQENAEIYLCFEKLVSGNSYLYHPWQITAVTYQNMYQQKMRKMTAYGLIFGICAIIGIYGLILFRWNRDPIYAWFSAAMLGFMMYFLSREGIGFELLWSQPPWLGRTHMVTPLAGFIISLSLTQFTLRLMIINNYQHWAVIIIYPCLVVMFMYALRHTSIDRADRLVSHDIYNICTMTISLTLVALGCTRLRSGIPAIGWLLAAFASAAAGVVVHLLMLASLLPYTFLTRHAISIGVVLQVVLLAVAMAQRVRSIYLSLLEREKSEKLLLTMLPAAIAQRLKAGESPIADRHAEVTVLFADIAGFTPLSSALPPEQVVQTLSTLFSRFDALTSARNLEKIKTIGDCYMVVGGLPSPRLDHAEAVADLALDLLSALATETAGLAPAWANVRIRIGLHCGSAVAGVIGIHKPAYDLWGDTVNTASRMESHGEPGRVHCTQAIRDALAHAFEFQARGEIEVRGKGRMPTYFLLGRRAASGGSATAASPPSSRAG